MPTKTTFSFKKSVTYHALAVLNLSVYMISYYIKKNNRDVFYPITYSLLHKMHSIKSLAKGITFLFL